jgi:hypothetical protein
VSLFLFLIFTKKQKKTWHKNPVLLLYTHSQGELRTVLLIFLKTITKVFIMSTLVQKVTTLLKDAQSVTEAVQVLTSTYPQLSPKEAESTVKDVVDFANKEMQESELEHWLKERGIA